MTRGAYFECFAGASGDMILGALVDAGWAEAELRETFGRMHLSGWALDVGITKKEALRATQVRIRVTEPQPERDVRDIIPLIENSDLTAPVKERAISLFRELADVEGIQHDQPPETVHFHEVGAVDSILDIVGACAGLHALGVEKIYVSPLNVGGGIVPTRDGILPVPGPAALELLRRKGAPIYASEYGPEFLTPTGALILATLADGFGPFPPMRVARVGYGAGQKDFSIPNVLRVSIGDLDGGLHARRIGSLIARRGSAMPTATGAASGSHSQPHGHEHTGEGDHAHGHSHGAPDESAGGHGRDHSHEHVHMHDLLEDEVVQLETNIDNMNPELYGHLSETLMAGGALDVTLAPVYMKKGRPGTLVSVLVHPEDAETAMDTLFAETTTLGVRLALIERRMLDRQSETVDTPYGPVRVKLAYFGGEVRSAAPEYDDCRQVAAAAGVPLQRVYDAAREAAGLAGSRT